MDENPFIENDQQETDITCCFDGDRICGPDCIAFDGRFEGDDRFSACILINLGRQVAKSLAGLAQAFRQARPIPPQTPPPEVKI